MTLPQIKAKYLNSHSAAETTVVKDTAKQGSRSIFLLVLLNAILVNAAYFILNYYKRDTFILSESYVTLLAGYNLVWLLNSLLFRKFQVRTYPNYKNLFLTITKSNLVFLYLLSIVIVIFGFYEYSRLQVFGSVLLLALFEWILYSAFYRLRGRAIYENRHGLENLPLRYLDFSFILFFADLLMLMVSFFLVNYYKRDTFLLNPDYEQLLLLIAGVWLIASVTTQKFNRNSYRNIWYASAPFIKALFIMAALGAVLLFALRMFEFSRLQFFGSLVLLLFLEAIAFVPYFLRNMQSASRNGDVESVQDVKEMLRQEILPFDPALNKRQVNEIFKPVYNKLRDVFLKTDPKLFDMLDRYLKLQTFDEDEVTVINTHTMYNVEIIDEHSQSLIVNLHKVNDFRWLNRYFLEVHKKIYNGGYFVGRVHTNYTHSKFIFRKYPRFIARFIYAVDFMWKRIFPKIPFLQQIYFIITRGYNRALSKAEVLGRLSFCGFKIVAVEEFNESLYFIVQRQKTPSLDSDPSYGPTIKLNRVGLEGKIIQVYKMRTMHPYSEYLQDYVFEQNSLDASGKFKDDFRLTEWGKLFRKMWIDELPQLKNYLRGELNLVGVRALSEHYFSLYPEDLRQLRIQFKPGLVPPYYADMPENFDEIIESERRYLLAKKNSPLLTDVRYFFKAMHNIFFNNARSQ